MAGPPTGGAVIIPSASGAPLQSTDVAPTSPGDTRSLSIFCTSFGLVLGGHLFGVASFQMATRLALRLRVISLLASPAVAAAAISVTAGSPGSGSLPAPLWKVAAVTFLLATAVASATPLLMRVGGSAGTLLAPPPWRSP